MNSYLCFSEGATYSEKNYPFLVDTLSENGSYISVRSGGFSWKVTGFSIVNNIPIIVFPKNYTVPENDIDIRNETMLLLKTLLRYRNEHEFDVEESELLFGDSSNDSSRISSAIFIIEDYLQYGLIRRKHEIYTTTRLGRTDWARTINKTIPLIGKSGIAYPEPVMRVNTFDTGNILRQIHEFVVGDCASLWGWLLDYDGEELEIKQLPCPLDEAIDILRKELTNTFVQREIALLNTMIEYLNALKGVRDNLKMEFLCTPYFHWVWEAICGYIFDNDYNHLKVYVPSPEWHSAKFTARIEQRPDILFHNKDTLYILDAKYYNYHRNLPGWHDVVKQFYYRLTLMKALNSRTVEGELAEIRRIENVFVFPGDKGSGTQYLGYVDVNDVDDLGTVKAYLIDSLMAMQAYALHEESDFKMNLITESEGDRLKNAKSVSEFHAHKGLDESQSYRLKF